MAPSERSSADGIKLDSIQREVLLGEIKNMLAAPLSSETRAPYEHLCKCIEDGGDIPLAATPHLGMMIES